MADEKPPYFHLGIYRKPRYQGDGLRPAIVFHFYEVPDVIEKEMEPTKSRKARNDRRRLKRLDYMRGYAAGKRRNKHA